MGVGLSHMNMYGIATVVETSKAEIIHIAESKQSRISIDADKFNEFMLGYEVCASDKRIFHDYAIMIDRMALGSISVTDFCICLLPMVTANVTDCFRTAFYLFDQTRSGLINKEGLFDVMDLLNHSFFYCGDVKFNADQVENFVNSVFTSGGKVGGSIIYDEFIDTIASHSLMELFFSQQFQGSWRNKVFYDYNEEEFSISIY